MAELAHGLDNADAVTTLLPTDAPRSDAMPEERSALNHCAASALLCAGLSREYMKRITTLVLAVLALSPTIDIISDVNAAIQIFENGYKYSFTAVVVIMLASWRFLVVFAALTPKPSIDKIGMPTCMQMCSG